MLEGAWRLLEGMGAETASIIRKWGPILDLGYILLDSVPCRFL